MAGEAMDGEQFDTIAKQFSARVPRRSLLRAAAAVGMGSLLGVRGRSTMAAEPCPASQKCGDVCCLKNFFCSRSERQCVPSCRAKHEGPGNHGVGCASDAD